MGAKIDDQDFYAIILASLPESYRPLLSLINTATKIMMTPLSPYKLVNIILEEYKHHMLINCHMTKKGMNSALSASVRGNAGRTRLGVPHMRLTPMQYVSTASARDTTRRTVGGKGEARRVRDRIKDREEALTHRSTLQTQCPNHLSPPTTTLLPRRTWPQL